MEDLEYLRAEDFRRSRHPATELGPEAGRLERRRERARFEEAHVNLRYDVIPFAKLRAKRDGVCRGREKQTPRAKEAANALEQTHRIWDVLEHIERRNHVDTSRDRVEIMRVDDLDAGLARL